MIANLSGVGCPDDLSCDWIQRCARGQVARTETQGFCRVGIGSADLEFQRLPQSHLVVGEGQDRQAVHVCDVQRDGLFRLAARRILNCEPERIGSRLVVARRPLEEARGGIEGGPDWQWRKCLADQHVSVRVDARQVELQKSALLATEWQHRKQQRCAIARRDRDRNGFRTAGCAVRHAQGDALVETGRLVARCPGQYASSPVEAGAGRQIDRPCVGQGIPIRVGGRQLQPQRGALGHGLVADRGQDGRCVGGARGDLNRLGVTESGRVGDGELDRCHTSICAGRRPGEPCGSVGCSRDQRRGWRQPLRREGQQVLILVACQQVEFERLTEQRHLVACQLQHRRFSRRHRRQHEGSRRHQFRHRTAIITVVPHAHRDHAVATVLIARCESQLGRPIGRGDEFAKVRQAGRRVNQRVAVGIGRGDVDLQHLALVDADGVQLRQRWRTVHVAHGDRHGDRGGQRHTGAVTVIGGNEPYRSNPGVGERRRPGENRGVRVEARARGQVEHGVGDAGSLSFDESQRSIADAVREGIAWVVGVEGESRKLQRLTLADLDPREVVEHRRRVGVLDGETHRSFGVADAIRCAYGDVVNPWLAESGGPGQYARKRVDDGTGGKNRRAESNGVAVGVGGVEIDAHWIALTDCSVGYRRDHRQLIRRQHDKGKAVIGAQPAVGDDQTHVLVSARGAEARCPLEHASGHVKDGAGRQPVHQCHRVVTVGVDRQHVDRELLAFAHDVDRGNGRHLGGVIATADGDREPLRGDCAATVDGAQHHRCAGCRFGRGHPCHNACGRVDLHARRTIHQQVT